MSKGICCTGDKEWEKRWQAEQDCDALCRAAAVNKDPERLAAAKKFAKERVTENKTRLAEAQAKIDLGEGRNP